MLRTVVITTLLVVCGKGTAGHHPIVLVGIISHKKSLITIFGHMHKVKFFIKKFDVFHVKISMPFGFWFIFGIKLQICNQNCIKNY